jgi:hypothetical protein
MPHTQTILAVAAVGIGGALAYLFIKGRPPAVQQTVVNPNILPPDQQFKNSNLRQTDLTYNQVFKNALVQGTAWAFSGGKAANGALGSAVRLKSGAPKIIGAGVKKVGKSVFKIFCGQHPLPLGQ